MSILISYWVIARLLIRHPVGCFLGWFKLRPFLVLVNCMASDFYCIWIVSLFFITQARNFNDNTFSHIMWFIYENNSCLLKIQHVNCVYSRFGTLYIRPSKHKYKHVSKNTSKHKFMNLVSGIRPRDWWERFIIVSHGLASNDYGNNFRQIPDSQVRLSICSM